MARTKPVAESTLRPSVLLDLVSAGLLLSSGLVHLLYPGRFVEAIANYRLLPFDLGYVLAGWLPVLHLVLAAALAQESLRPAARLGVAALGLVFLVAQGSAAWRGLEISCDCFRGPDAVPISWSSAAPAVALLVAGTGACLLGRTNKGTTP